MKREIITTSDGSTTIRLAEWDECYHSKHGAIVEAYHVFIKNGLSLFMGKPVSILEVGFGTGLNAFITYLESTKSRQQVDYTGVDAFPVSTHEARLMNYVNQLDANVHLSVFEKMHDCSWEIKHTIDAHFSLTKRNQDFTTIADSNAFDLIYFDAFGYRVQPELWSTDIFRRMHEALKPGGVLVTYAARGVVKRSMVEVGFSVEKLDGPPGKREMFRARKSSGVEF